MIFMDEKIMDIIDSLAANLSGMQEVTSKIISQIDGILKVQAGILEKLDEIRGVVNEHDDLIEEMTKNI
jgi:uncharacterized protein YoxC